MIGDGVFIGGVVWEGLNNFGVVIWFVIVVFNDNGCFYDFIVGVFVVYLEEFCVGIF